MMSAHKFARLASCSVRALYLHAHLSIIMLRQTTATTRVIQTAAEISNTYCSLGPVSGSALRCDC